MRRVRLRGAGLVSSYGAGLARAMPALAAARSGATPLTRFTLPFADHIAVNEIDAAAFPHTEAGVEALLLTAIHEALQRAGTGMDAQWRADCALLLGSSGFLFIAEAARRDQTPAARLGASGDVAARLGRRLGLGGPALTLSTACSSSANALLVGADMIRRGDISRCLVVGVEGLSAIVLHGFYSLMLLDARGSRPFDAERNGMQLGEAAAAVLLEAETSDTAPGAYLSGGANLCDARSMTGFAPDAHAMRAAMAQALDHAAVAPDRIAGIKAHGAGSRDSDAAEATALCELFGPALPPVTSLKRYFGHTLGASGAVETAAWLACLEAGFLPPAAGFERHDTALGVEPLRRRTPAHGGDYLLNFFGFGASYVSLVIHYA